MGKILSRLCEYCPCVGRDKPNPEVEKQIYRFNYNDFSDLEQQELGTLLKFYMLKASQR